MHNVDPHVLTLYETLDLIGVVLNGIIGGTIARQRDFDLVGFIFLALFSALGGGMLRDVLMDRGTAAAIANSNYLLLAIVGAILALLFHFDGKRWELFKVHADAVILGVWAVTGAVKALTFSMPLTSAVLLGVLTAVGGGMIRDVVTGQVPSIFGGGPLYAVPALVAAVTMVVFAQFDLITLGMLLAAMAGAGLAILAYWKHWILFRPSDLQKISMTPRQLNALIKRSERKGYREGRDA
ncbi:trimeric intracellular cation channel family protein [Corynebacterium pseudopelargi]|uniref:Glycine transporter domain-containing protein n=1 Tax=Corynebacterium pseudopelargi TaxID=2080757 RepID=A0A3G6ITC6_9CORY|nr:trimeric intracellular cation channel family protein [Corynebacterium pseudopelargi]AZA08837.1 hypothetical protein CPPEL_03540 [Corynebacterium pseudopelargi]